MGTDAMREFESPGSRFRGKPFWAWNGKLEPGELRRQIRLIDEESGLSGCILRPLCAGRLEPTLAEQRGIIDRSRLYSFAGRSRAPQLALAKKLGITEFGSPGGGCKLTTAGFTPKLLDFLAHYGDADLRDAELLSVGRHFRLTDQTKLVVGRNEDENRLLHRYAEADPARYTYYVPTGFAGPTALVCGPTSGTVDRLVGKAILRYAHDQQAPFGGFAISVEGAGGGRTIAVDEPFTEEDLAALRISGAERPAFARSQRQKAAPIGRKPHV